MSNKLISVFRFSAILTFFLLTEISLTAQKFNIELSKDTIGFFETVSLTLSGETREPNFSGQFESPRGLEVISSTKKYSSNSSNGKYKFTQTFVLQPYEIGTFILGPIGIQVGSNRVYSNKVRLVVKPGNQNSTSENIFIRCDLDKKKAVIGEQIVLSLRLYSAGVQVSPGLEWPKSKSFSGFWSKEVPSENTFEDSSAIINGRKYHIVTIYKRIIFPNTTGLLTIPSFEYACFIKQNMLPTGDPFVDGIMGIETPIQLKSVPTTIEVSPIPNKNLPTGFSGDVGEFSVSSEINLGHVKVNEPVVMKVIVSGKGNIELLRLPTLKFPSELESFSSVSGDTITITSTGIEGSKTFSITLIPKKEGQYKIPGISFSYFDPKKKEFVTINTPEFSLAVDPSDPSMNVTENNLPESFLTAKSKKKIFIRILLIAFPSTLLILLLIFRSRKKKKEAEELLNLEKNQEEINELEKPIAKPSPDYQAMINIAEHFFIKGNTKAGIAQLYETLLTAICFKTEIQREEASINQLKYRLRLKNFEAEFIQEVLSFLEELAEKRYSEQPISTVKLAENLQNTRKLTMKLR